jgi:hypothetical protein
MLIHFIWVGDNKITDSFIKNIIKVKEDNPEDTIMEWNDESLVPILEKYGRCELYNNSNIFHKLQIARYTVLDFYGGLYTDYDVYWKIPIVKAINSKEDKDLIFIKRNSLFFYKKQEIVLRLSLLDDYVIFAKPNFTDNFLRYSLDRAKDRTRLKEDKTEPFSVYSLTEWVYDSNFDIDYFSHHEIYDNPDCEIACHDNKKTWNF